MEMTWEPVKIWVSDPLDTRLRWARVVQEGMNPLTQMSDPGKAKLSGCNPLPFRDSGQFFNNFDVMLYILEKKTDQRTGGECMYLGIEPLLRNVRIGGACHSCRGPHEILFFP